MINLIPPTAKRAMKREYWQRVGVVWLLLLAVVMVVAMLLLVPSFVLVQSQLQAYESQLQNATRAAEEQDALTAEVSAANAQATMLVALAAVDPIEPYIAKIRALQGSAIVVRQFAVARSKSTAVETITVTGTARDRQSLAAFSAALTADPAFTDAAVPLANLAANEDIGFSLTVNVATP